MCVRFSISTKVKFVPFCMALVLLIVYAVIELLGSVQNALIIFGFDILPFKGFIGSIFSFFIGVLITLTMGFITPRIDKKLQILNKDYFLPLLERFNSYTPEYYIAEIEKAKKTKEDLLKYGKYFKIPCYPRKLTKDIDEFFEYAEEHNNLLIQLVNISKKKIGKDNLRILLGSLHLANVNLKNYNQDTVKRYEIVSNYVTQEKTELLEKMKTSIKKIREMRHSIIERFESFLKDNSLEKPSVQNTVKLI